HFGWRQARQCPRQCGVVRTFAERSADDEYIALVGHNFPHGARFTTYAVYCGSRPALSRTAFHLATSSAMNWPNSAEPISCTAAPTFAIWSLISGRARTCFSAALVLSTIALGVPAG